MDEVSLNPKESEQAAAHQERARIKDAYIKRVLKKGQPPASVFSFTKKLGMEEREFFEHFASFEALESAIWGDLVHEVALAVTGGEEWHDFTAREKMLAFYYSFCEAMLDHRSFFLARFPRAGDPAYSGMKSSAKLKKHFRHFVHPVLDAGIGSGELKQRGPIGDRYPRILTTHFLSVIQFNLCDESEGFARTDAFIEKSTHLAFDLMGAGVVDSAIDLARFLGGNLRYS